MIGLMIFSGIAALIVWFAGRKDSALDPRLTAAVLALLLVFPLLVLAMPKVSVLPAIGVSERLSGWPWVAALSGIWLIGGAVSLARLAVIAAGISRWRKRSRLLEIASGVEVRALAGLRGPVAAGVFRKLIFVPDDWAAWEESRREIVMRHELEHHRRHDPFWRWIAGLAVAVHWFNPLVRWIVRRLMIQCEFACDSAVLRSGVSTENYATLLCDLAEDKSFGGPVLAMAEKSGLESRVERMMMVSRRGTEGVWAKWLIVFALAAAVVLAVLGARESFGFSVDEIRLRRTADPFPGS